MSLAVIVLTVYYDIMNRYIYYKNGIFLGLLSVGYSHQLSHQITNSLNFLILFSLNSIFSPRKLFHQGPGLTGLSQKVALNITLCSSKLLWSVFFIWIQVDNFADIRERSQKVLVHLEKLYTNTLSNVNFNVPLFNT